MIPPARTGGASARQTCARCSTQSAMYIARVASGGSCQEIFPPRTTVYFWEWTRYGVLDRIHQTLME